MENNFKALNLIYAKLNSQKQISLSDIPAIDLYMDQVTSFFETFYGDLRRNEKDTILTKTMINNYAKAKILTPIVNKKYNKIQIVLLIFIYKLKQNLSLDDIKRVLFPLIELLNEEFDKYVPLVYSTYEYFMNIIEVNDLNSDKVLNLVTEFDSEEYSKESIELCQKLLTVLAFSHLSTLNKRMCEQIIDTFYEEVK